MSVLDQYKIDLIGLKNQEQDFEFVIQDAFFQAMQTDLLQKANVSAKVRIRKSELMIHLEVQLKGVIELICDRSLEPFEYPIDVQERLILQFGDKQESLDDDLEIIARNANYIALAQHFYEYIAMEIPFKKLHPKFADEIDEDEDADVKLIYSSSTDDATEDDKPVDDRWEALKKLSKN